MMLQVLEETLRRRRSEGWLVGGTVRDRWSGRISPDLDVVVADDPAKVAQEVSASLRSPWFALSARHGAYRVLGGEGHIDVAGMRGAGILDDLAARDFTINAMAIPVRAGSEGEVIDPFGGREHLAAGVLVAVSDEIFTSDPLRLMRAVRFCHLLGLHMAPALERLVRAQAGELIRSAPERIVAELALTLDGADSATAVDRLADLGLLRTFLPQVAVGDALATLKVLDAMISGGPWSSKAVWAPPLVRRMTVPVDGTLSRVAALRMGGLLRLQSPHEVAVIGRRLKLSGAAVSLMRTVAGWHDRSERVGGAVLETLSEVSATPRTATTFFWDTAPWEPEVILVAAAAAAGPGTPAAAGFTVLKPGSPADLLLERWAQRLAGLPDPPFDGAVLMAALGLTQGPILGRLLREARLAWEADEIHTLEEAVEVVRAAWGFLAE